MADCAKSCRECAAPCQAMVKAAGTKGPFAHALKLGALHLAQHSQVSGESGFILAVKMAANLQQLAQS